MLVELFISEVDRLGQSWRKLSEHIRRLDGITL